MNVFDELVSLDGVLLAGRFGPDGRGTAAGPQPRHPQPGGSSPLRRRGDRAHARTRGEPRSLRSTAGQPGQAPTWSTGLRSAAG